MEDITSHHKSGLLGTTEHELKTQRLSELHSQIETELQQSVTEAARIRQLITTAKTDCKRKFYEKKFSTIRDSVRQGVTALQQISQLQAEYEKDEASAAS